MKIGIITIFNVPNYGAILQCYALTKYLEDLGHDVFLYEVSFSKSNRFIRYLKKKMLLFNMTDFVNSKLPPRTTNLSTAADLYMVGSDQVWNPDILGAKIETFMLSFAPQGAKKVAYAASFGSDRWFDDSMYNRAKQLLSDFKYLTVREGSGVELLKRQFGLRAYQVLDPCFLLDNYRALTSDKIQEKEQLTTYKLVYSYDWHLKVKGLACTLGCSLLELNPRYIKTKGDIRGLNVRFYPVPFWLSSIASAKYIVTDSFHGCVFSLLFHKQFVVLPGIKERSTRLLSLLTLLNLTDRISYSVDDCEAILRKEIDYKIVSNTLNRLREESRSILLEMLQI